MPPAKPADKVEASQSITALTTKEKRPKVKKYSGKEKNLTTGRKIILTKVSIKPTDNADVKIPKKEPSLAKLMWVVSREVIQIANAEKATRAIKFMGPKGTRWVPTPQNSGTVLWHDGSMSVRVWPPCQVELRPEVVSLPKYVPGARPASDSDVVKLSSNENPYRPLLAVLEAITTAANEVNRYPDMQATELMAALAARAQVQPEQVAVGNGSVALLSHILAAVVQPGDEVIYPWRSFEAYPIAISVAGAKGVPVPINAAGSNDLTDMVTAITDKTKLIFVCSPNNPTGAIVTETDFVEFMEKVPTRVLVVLDEAYAEFVRDREAVDGLKLLDRFPNLITLRTLSKAQGLAGLRVGYAIGHPDVIAGVRATATPFGVNMLAQAGAVASLTSGAEQVLSHRVGAIVAERARVLGELRQQGWQVPEAQGNFVWLPLGAATAELAEAAKADGILVRPFGDEGVRVTIADGAANNQFLWLANQWANELQVNADDGGFDIGLLS